MTSYHDHLTAFRDAIQHLKLADMAAELTDNLDNVQLFDLRAAMLERHEAKIDDELKAEAKETKTKAKAKPSKKDGAA